MEITLGDLITICIQIASVSYIFGVHRTKIERLEKDRDEMRDDIKNIIAGKKAA